jgi:methionyl-tRNA formyltransferase
MDEDADSGDLLSQRDVPIRWTDDARTLYDRILDTAAKQVAAFTPQLADRKHRRVPQNDDEANYWRKRSYEDGGVDWRMSSTSIYNLIRALARPYPGAHCMVDGDEMKLWGAKVVDDEFEDVSHLEPGKVLASEEDRIAVKCGEGVISIQEHEFDTVPDTGAYLR